MDILVGWVLRIVVQAEGGQGTELAGSVRIRLKQLEPNGRDDLPGSN